ncbi:glutaredoxin family protein [Marinicellulosiphila megalodicopiae]|uniref:glutaredoxin family protein n=1 Tax=Marinicellulosiphila megalodicopiae TaxID=2724896 RepID=UPI003BB0151E
MNPTKTIYAMFFILLLGLIAFIAVAATTSSYESTQVHSIEQAKVIIYGTPQCHYCKKTRKLLSQNVIAYFEYDISSNKEAYNTFVKLEGRGTPLIIIGNQVIKGFDESRIRKLLNIEQDPKAS